MSTAVTLDDIDRADLPTLRELVGTLETRMLQLDDASESRALTADEDRDYRDSIDQLKRAQQRVRQLTDERMTEQRQLGQRFREAVTTTRDQRDPSRPAGDQKPWQHFPPTVREYRRFETRALAEGAAASGGVLVPIEYSKEFFDKVRPRSVVLAAGPRVLDMERMILSLPALDTSATVSWVAENQPIPPSDPIFKAVTLQPKKLAGLVVVANELANDSDPAARQVVGLVLEREVASALDKAMLAGDGTANSIVGLANVPGVNSVTLLAPITLDDIAAAVTRMEASNIQPSAIFLTPQIWAALRAEKDLQDRYLLDPVPTEAAPARVFGVPVFPTSNLTTTAGKSSVIVAGMEYVVVGRRVPFELAFDTGGEFFKNDQTAIRIISRWDINALTPAAVEVLKDATPAAAGTMARAAKR